ncbi:hypothetical protein RDWZM_001429 [Blomia tropicalis]|uniref:Uncharacterized protein n=1 Tax=Blomia tropicalis TaxID=40697 RepID=A0A9Q0MBY5_BLOTA|nr:hypothetical protein RDWZM_001429 [Blomia tropicalis]
MHAAFSAAQYRSFLRVSEQNFTGSLPMDIVLQAGFSLILTLYMVVVVSGQFKEIFKHFNMEPIRQISKLLQEVNLESHEMIKSGYELMAKEYKHEVQSILDSCPIELWKIANHQKRCTENIPQVLKNLKITDSMEVTVNFQHDDDDRELQEWICIKIPYSSIPQLFENASKHVSKVDYGKSLINNNKENASNSNLKNSTLINKPKVLTVKNKPSRRVKMGEPWLCLSMNGSPLILPNNK